MTGIEAHANILANLIHNNIISAASTTARWIVSFLISILGLLGFLKTSGRNSLLIWIAGMVAAAAVSFALFSALQLWYSPVLFVISFSFMFVAAQVYRLERSWRELAEARDQWEESFNAIDDAIVLMDERCRIARMNNAGKTMQEPEILDLLKARGKLLLESDADKSDGNDFDTETETEVHSENKRYFGIRTLPSRDLEGRCKGVVHVVRDITARKIAEEEKELLQFQLLQSQKMESIGRLAGGIAHDFNNILTVILTCSELVLRKTDDEYQRKQMQIIQDSGNKAASLIRQLLVFSRKEVLELQVVDLNRVVENLGGILERVIGEDVTLRLLPVKGIKPVMADPGHMEQVIMNLSVNARDAMPKGGFLTIETGEIYLDEEYARVHSGVSPGLYVVLTITDTGVGMTPEVKERIFEPFFTTKKAGQGTGLGMSTVFGIIKQMSGHIHLYSEVGRGSVFKIYLPSCSKVVEEKPAASSLILPRGSEAILIAEDDPVVRQLMLDTLTPLGYRVKVACNGAEAMKIIDTGEKFHILLTDVVMPETGGKELAQYFQDKQPGAKVLFMSGYTDEMMILQGLEQKDLAFVQKPCTPSRLVIKLRRMLDGE
jgi:signal transduction histidine kinase/CheY-like chemotaxis protein